MTYRSIFVHVNDTEAYPHRLDYAARLAKKYPAELLGGYIVPPSELTPYAKAVMSPDSIKQYVLKLAALRDTGEANFRAAATRNGVAAIEWRAPAGNPIGQAVLHARHSDLAILGQPPRDDAGETFAAELANAVVTRCGRPALPLLKDAKKVFAIAVTPESDETARETFTDAQLSAFLRRHDIEATVRRIFAADIDAGELLLSQAADVGADLIVMGAYSRPRLSELAWGSVTRVMLSSMTAPVLMSH